MKWNVHTCFCAGDTNLPNNRTLRTHLFMWPFLETCDTSLQNGAVLLNSKWRYAGTRSVWWQFSCDRVRLLLFVIRSVYTYTSGFNCAPWGTFKPGTWQQERRTHGECNWMMPNILLSECIHRQTAITCNIPSTSLRRGNVTVSLGPVSQLDLMLQTSDYRV
jgi:hypothetical protein